MQSPPAHKCGPHTPFAAVLPQHCQPAAPRPLPQPAPAGSHPTATTHTLPTMSGDSVALLAQRLQVLQDEGVKVNPATANPAPLGLYGFALTTALLQGSKTQLAEPKGTAQVRDCRGCPVWPLGA